MPKKRGRPTDYREEYAEQAKKLCMLLGATTPKLAQFFGVATSTVDRWMVEIPAFSEAVRAGKEIADTEVAHSLYQRAVGYEHDAVKILQFQGSPVVVPYTERYAPDTEAAKWWLKNRQREVWRDRFEVETRSPLAGIDDDKLARLIKFAERLEELEAGQEPKLVAAEVVSTT